MPLGPGLPTNKPSHGFDLGIYEQKRTHKRPYMNLHYAGKDTPLLRAHKMIYEICAVISGALRYLEVFQNELPIL